MANLLKKYRGLICYLIFGIGTTAINLAVYYICYNLSGLSNMFSTVIAWVVAVLFAFVTNKLFVFESKSMERNIILYEVLTFFSLRFATGLMDIVIMYISVDVINMNAMMMKFLSNILAIILNYLASKLFIFKRKVEQA